jgi:hypothetical protein
MSENAAGQRQQRARDALPGLRESRHRQVGELL